MSPGKLVDEKDVGCQDKSGPGKIHEVILVSNVKCTTYGPFLSFFTSLKSKIVDNIVESHILNDLS